MMGFSSYDDSNVFQWLKLVSIGGSCSEPFSHLHWTHKCVLGPDGKLKPEEWKHHHENHLCMICGKANHRTATCPAATRGHAAILEEPQETPDTAPEEQGTEGPPESGQVN